MKRLLAIVATGCAAIALILSGGVASANAASAAVAPVQKIVYADLNGGIWIVKGNGSGLHEISTVTADSVSFSPDGKTIAYTTGSGGLWTIPVTGGAPRHINVATAFIEYVAWSPNGKWLAYTGFSGGHRSAIYRIPAHGGSVQRLTSVTDTVCDSVPAWSPDSSAIVYVGGPSGATSCGLVVQRIGQPGKVVVSGLGMRGGSFTPTGNLVYVTQCQDLDVCGDVVVSYESNADGSNPTLIDGAEDSCRDGDLCQNAVVGAPRGRGWVQELDVNPVEVGFSETCFQGGYQQAGIVTKTSPSFCLINAESVGYDAA